MAAARRNGPADYAFAALMLIFAGITFTALFGGPDLLGDWSSFVLGSVWFAYFAFKARGLEQTDGRRQALRVGQAGAAVLVVVGLLSGLLT